MDEGTFVGWLKQDGEPVKIGEPLFTIEGDKASQEIEATDSGILRIPPDAPKAGSPVSVGAVLGYLVGDDEGALPVADLSRPEAVPLPLSLCPTGGESARRAGEGDAERGTAAERSQPVALANQGPTESGPVAFTVTISPRARRRAAELGLDYRRLKGSGRTGRIIEADVLAAAQEPPASSASTMRRMIAQRTAESFSRAPHFYLRTEVDATALLELRERLLPNIEKATGVRLTLTDLLLRAQALALRDCPQANAIWQGDGIVRFEACDVGLVVGLDDGLRVPIVRGADGGGLTALVKQRAALVDAARTGKLTAEAMQGGATSLSNLGSGSVDEFAAVISPPQSSMFAVGRASPRPFVIEGQLVVRTTLKLCLSVDHRVMDGGPAGKFLGRIVELVEHPAELTHE
jgi:pyruvate dehydrogenase E2 component (dihydrolipoamide acetyltransferase)